MSDLQPNRRRGIITGRRIPSGTLPDVIEAPFPERRALHWVPPDRVTTDEFSIVVTSDVLLQTSRHVAQTLEHERGGFLLGNRYRCPNTGREYIIIDQYVEADFTESTDVSLTFTHEAWGQLDDKMTGKYYGKKLVGWYHSHPRMSIFLSEHDIAIHRERFAEPWMVALVLEPEKHMGGFFVWSDGKLDPNRYVNFYELLEGESRETVVSWKNYVGVDPLEGAAPPIAPVNTLTISSLAAPQVGDDDRKPPVVTTAGRRVGILPDWLHGNLSYFGLAALAVLVFISTLGFTVFWPRVQRWLYQSAAARSQTNEDVFKNFDYKLEDRGAVDFGDGKITIKLNLMNLPEEAARGLKTTVSIDGQDAVVNQSLNGSDVLVEAVAPLGDNVRALEASEGKDIGLQIRCACEYGGARQSFALSVARMQVLKGQSMNLDFGGIVKPAPPPPVIVSGSRPAERPKPQEQRPAPPKQQSTPRQQPTQRQQPLTEQEVRNSEVIAAKRKMQELEKQKNEFKGDKKSETYRQLQSFYETAKKFYQDKKKQLNRPEDK